MLSQLDLNQLYPRYGFPNDILSQILLRKGVVLDVPVRAIYGDEKSGINPLICIPKMLLLILKIGVLTRKTAFGAIPSEP
jgi:hypothetical protein